MGKNSGNNKYNSTYQTTRYIEPYRDTRRQELIDNLRHDEVLIALISVLKNRQDAREAFSTSVLKSLRFWFFLLTPSLVLTILISCGCGYLFRYHPNESSHVLEKMVNSKIPDLIPMASG